MGVRARRPLGRRSPHRDHRLRVRGCHLAVTWPSGQKHRGPASLGCWRAAGDHGKEVTRLQRRLEELRYWVGPKDGAFGPLTEQAVMALQGAAGLPASHRRDTGFRILITGSMFTHP